MITFLAPFAFFAASLLAIPVILHLFKPRKVRQTPFSSLRWLHLSQQKLARRIKWHQVLLFLLRAAFIALLVLAIAKPMVSPRGEGGFVERFIVLDVSRSMGYQAPGRPTPLANGKEAAVKIIGRGLAGDRTAVMLTGATTRSLGPLSRDPAVYLPAIKAAQVTHGDTDLASALQVVRPMLAHRRAGARVEIYFITDSHQQSWRQGGVGSFLKDLNIPVQVRVIDVGVNGAQNGWVANAKVVETTKPARRLVRVQVGCVGDAGQERTVRVGGLQGLPEMTQSIKSDPGALSQVEFELPAAFDARGKVARVSIEPADALPDDDEFFLNLDARATMRVLLVEADSTQIESMRPGFYLRTALSALAVAESRSVESVSRTSTTVTPEEITAADAVLLADVPELPDTCLTALESRVKAGGGLAVFLGPDIQPTFYNTKFFKPLLPTESLLPAPLKAIAHAPPQGLYPMTGIQWAHPLLAPLYDPVLGDFSQTLFRSYYDFDGNPQGTAVLATIDEHTPAILERSLGAGKVILFNTTANDAWGDMPRRKSYVPLIDRLLTYLAGGSLRRSFQVGDTVALPLQGAKADDPVTVTTPGGGKIKPVLKSEAGRLVMRIDGVQDPGVYHVEPSGGAASFAFVVQTGRGDSVLTPTDATTLKKWWEPASLEVLSPDADAKGVAMGTRRVALWPWLVAAACFVFLAEMFFVHYLCPRMNPGVVASVVPKRGMFSVKSDEPEKVSV